VPLWLDEGLAEYFELPPAYAGVNFQHLDYLRNTTGGPFRPDLARLEQLPDFRGRPWRAEQVPGAGALRRVHVGRRHRSLPAVARLSSKPVSVDGEVNERRQTPSNGAEPSHGVLVTINAPVVT